MLKTIKNGAVVCNIGHFDNEIGTAFMRKTWVFKEVKPQSHKVYCAAGQNKSDFALLLSESGLVNLGNATGDSSRIINGSIGNKVLAQMHLKSYTKSCGRYGNRFWWRDDQTHFHSNRLNQRAI